ncbi:MAG TPA: hypothetical protein VFF73_34195, partial [Planctomycetota bacterium]|nr:hypothetical protein [Planctomycetota bacterium]
MRRAQDKDLVAGALALAFKYSSLGELRAGMADLDTSGDLVESLVRKTSLAEPRAEKLRRATRLACLLKDDAVYGMIAL